VITPDALIAQARQWIGVRYVHQGRTRFGSDCLGFPAGVLGELDSTAALEYLPANYPQLPQPGYLLGRLHAYTRQIPLQPAALILVQWPLMDSPTHVAIYTGVNLIHCTQSEGKVVENGYRGPWVKRTHSIWALPEVQYLAQGNSESV
jgi:cell wall-associated NlpC family hydrolase